MQNIGKIPLENIRIYKTNWKFEKKFIQIKIPLIIYHKFNLSLIVCLIILINSFKFNLYLTDRADLQWFRKINFSQKIHSIIRLKVWKKLI